MLSKVGNGRFSEQSENIVFTALCLLTAGGCLLGLEYSFVEAELWSHHQGCLATGPCHATKFQIGLGHKYPVWGIST